MLMANNAFHFQNLTTSTSESLEETLLTRIRPRRKRTYDELGR
jgi:hypothetical protein